MNEPNASRISEWVLRRRAEPLQLFGHELSPDVWLIVLGVVLLAAFFYVGWMYVKDSRSVGPWWASFLGLLRSTVYVVLAAVFLLPAQQNWEETRVQSRVVTVHDVSDSLPDTIDDPPGSRVRLSRQDKVLQFLNDPRAAFFPGLEKKNPVTVYRFAKGPDDESFYLVDGRFYTRAEWEEQQREQPRAVEPPPADLWASGAWKAWAWRIAGAAILALGLLTVLARSLARGQRRGLAKVAPRMAVGLLLVAAAGGACLYVGFSGEPAAEQQAKVQASAEQQQKLEARPLPAEYLQRFLKPGAKEKLPDDLAGKDKKALEELVARNKKMVEKEAFNGTNVGDSVLALFNREQNNMLQGIVVFTDGRSTEGSPQAFQDLAERSRAAQVPIFVVAVGENRPRIKTEVVDTRTAPQAQPDDKFPVVGEITGEGQPDKEVKVALEITHVRKRKDGKEELLPIKIVEAEDKNNPDKKREEIDLGKAVTLVQTVKFDRSSPPRAGVEFQVDALTLLKAAGKEPREEDAKKKWELGETKDGQLRFRLRVPKDTREIVDNKKFAESTSPAELRVIKKPLRVLLFASAPTREYQFIRTLLVREMEKKRGELSIHLQLPPGREERRTGVVQDIPKERLLDIFPNRYKSKGKEDKLYDLADYDVIVAFDPDWTRLTREQLDNVSRWVGNGGGLIVIGGPINTIQLARPGEHKQKLQPIIDLYPVVLKDYRIEDDERPTSDPHALDFTDANPEMEFLKLEESDDKVPFLSDWRTFFYGEAAGDKRDSEKTVVRGFFNFYPVEKAKPGTLIAARFIDPQARLADKTYQPFLVLTDKASGRRVVWLGAGEMWRLRSYREAYHERFWTKLIRYAGADSHAKISRRIDLQVAREQKVNRPIRVEARIEQEGGKPLPATAKPELTLKLPVGQAPPGLKTNFVMVPKPGREGWFTATVQVVSEGDYGLDLKVPETSDTEHGSFHASQPRPEQENTRPDFTQMYFLASEADEVLARMGEADRAELKRNLKRPQLDDSAQERGEAKEGKLRLYFDLGNAHLIPKCMTTKQNVNRSRLPYKDLWDEGWTIRAGDGVNKPVKFSWVLTIVVGLLSAEWLTRKLLRLA